MGGEPIVVVSLGASTAVGRDAWASAAAVRAGISGFVEHPYMIDTAGEPMRAAIAPWLDINLRGVGRFEALIYPAIDQALAPVDAMNNPLRIALSLGLPATRPGLEDQLQRDLEKRIRFRYRHVFAAAASFPKGHVAGLLALEAAFRKLSQGGLDACVVAGVDSYMEPETLEWLEACDQLHGAGVLNNAWGFVPGEAAGAVLLVREEYAAKMGLQSLARIVEAGVAHESKPIKTETVCIGEGLTQAFRGALAALPADASVSDIYCDMNGEPYRADEYGFACLRTREFFDAPADFTAPADCWGDVAAAGGPLHLGLAAISGAKGYAKGAFSLAWASSEAGERAAVLVEVGQVN